MVKQLQDSPENIWLVFKRAVDLSRNEINLEYENPWDTALAVYLWALSMVNLEMAQTAAGFVIQAENGWWATKFANLLLQYEERPNAVSFHKFMEFESIKQKLVSQRKPEIKFSEKQVQSLRTQKIVKPSAVLEWTVKGSRTQALVVNRVSPRLTSIR